MVLAAEIGEQLPVPLDRVGATAAGEAVVAAHVHAEQLAVRALRHARGAPDQRLGTRRAGDRDQHPLARLPRLGDVVAARGSSRDPRRPGRRATAARARAARRGCRAGSSSRARRRCGPTCRRCRAPCAGAAPPASCRRARSGRRGARSPSGIVSRCFTPVMRSTTSLTDSRCWMLSVEITSMPGVEQLLDVLPALLVAPSPGTLVCASSSTSTTSGRRASTASTSISSNSVSRYSILRRGTTSRSPSCSAVRGPPVRLDDRRPPRRCPARGAAGPR